MNKLSIIAAAAAIAAVAVVPGATLAGDPTTGPTDPYVVVPQQDDDDFGLLPWIILGGTAVALGLTLGSTSASTGTPDT